MTPVVEDGNTVAIIAVLKNIKKAIYAEIGFDQDLAEPVFFSLHQRIADAIALKGEPPEVSSSGILFVVGKSQKDYWNHRVK